MKKLALVESDVQLCQTICVEFSTYEWRCFYSMNSFSVESLLHMDLVIIGDSFPHDQAFDLVVKLRALDQKVPILFMTNNASKDLVMKCLNVGVNQFLEKPMSHSTLNQVLEQLLKDSSVIRLSEGYFIHKGSKILHHKDQPVALTPTEYLILETLVLNQNRCVSKTELIQAVWGTHSSMSENTLDTHLCNLRKKCNGIASNIRTIRSRGYIWNET
jgi:DNA-binding response OmpR family regulator